MKKSELLCIITLFITFLFMACSKKSTKAEPKYHPGIVAFLNQSDSLTIIGIDYYTHIRGNQRDSIDISITAAYQYGFMLKNLIDEPEKPYLKKTTAFVCGDSLKVCFYCSWSDPVHHYKSHNIELLVDGDIYVTVLKNCAFTISDHAPP